ncbi:uncharacterized protein [Spinacia oleracea]|uniref:Transposase n=1 Tax=Spinacia oleracea TaxID=3562 RepID=A0A9R0I106_SPIOL|nr:uncharacterized protein LOC110780261 [Spinacia oleracea]
MTSDFNLNDAWFPDDEDEEIDGYSGFNLNDAPIPESEMEEDSGSDGNHHIISYDNSSDDDMEEVGDILQGNAVYFDLNHPPLETPLHQTGNQQQATQNHPKRRRLSSQNKLHILIWLLDRATRGKKEYGSIKAATTHFGVVSRTISRIWNTTRRQKQAMQRYNLATLHHNAGRKRIQLDIDELTKLAMGDRTCIRDLVPKLGITRGTIHRMIKRGGIKPHTNPLHPGLGDPNKIARMAYISGMLVGDAPETKTRYKPYDYVHLDEKWFYLTKKSQRCYLARNEKGKHRAAPSSKWIPKVMFTAVVARPRFNTQKECTFDGKIGIFPFTYSEPAKRRSKYKEKGTLVTKVIESVNQKVTRSMLIEQIIPAIIEKWPPSEGPKTIFIQQDNAKAHVTQDDAIWQQVYQQGDFTFILVQQPPNSPDMNILDLGFFRSIQSLLHKKMPKDVDAMMQAVHDDFYELEPKTLSNVWYSLQYVWNAILKSQGANEYVLPHVNKARLEAEGRLEEQVRTSSNVGSHSSMGCNTWGNKCTARVGNCSNRNKKLTTGQRHTREF